MNDSGSTPTGGKRRGCLFYGCLTMVVLALLLCVAAYFTVRLVKNQIYSWTDSAPVKLPKVEMTENEFSALSQRVKAFSDAMDQGKAAVPLVLTDRDINALIARAPNGRDWADKIHVSLDGDQIKGQVSFPLDQLVPFGKGRYLNGEATLRVSLENGVLHVTVQEVKARGKALPEVFMKEMRKQDFAQQVLQDPKSAEAVKKLESIQVQDSRLTIKARGTN